MIGRLLKQRHCLDILPFLHSLSGCYGEIIGQYDFYPLLESNKPHLVSRPWPIYHYIDTFFSIIERGALYSSVCPGGGSDRRRSRPLPLPPRPLTCACWVSDERETHPLHGIRERPYFPLMKIASTTHCPAAATERLSVLPSRFEPIHINKKNKRL